MLQYCMPRVHEPTQHSDWPLLTSVIDRHQIFVFLKIAINRNCSSVLCLSYVPPHRFSMNSNGRGRQKSYISKIVPVRLSERVWCTKIFSLLLKSYFHLSGFQYSFLLLHFRDGPKRCKIDTKPKKKKTYPVSEAPLSISGQRSFASSPKSLRHNRSFRYSKNTALDRQQDRRYQKISHRNFVLALEDDKQ